MRKNLHSTVKQLNAHIEKIEGIVTDLLAGVELDALLPVERLALAARFLGLYQHAVGLRHSCEVALPDRRDNVFLASIARYMRGEDETPEEKLRVVAELSEVNFVEDEDEDGIDY
jgi:hypothetical protein